MFLLVIGLVMFLGVHSARIFAEDKRTAFINDKGELAYKGIYSIVSIIGFIILIIGYGQARESTGFIWVPPVFLSHIAALLMLFAFVLLVAAYVPGNHIKARLGHPMVLAVKVWAVAHLLSNGRLADIVLFGAFLVWAIIDFSASRKRDRLSGTASGTAAEPALSRDVIVVAVGLGAYIATALWLHKALIGVSPFSS